MRSNLGPKNLSFIAVMAALGNVLSFISIRLAPIVPSIPLGPISVSLALDLSHLSTFIAAFFGGPLLGGLTGLIGGFVAAFEFGFSQGNIITGICLPVGKAMTGVAAGLIVNLFQLDKKRLMTVLTTVIAYIPEGILTTILFVFVFPIVFGMSVLFAKVLATQIIAKALLEMVVMGLVLMGVQGNQGLTGYVRELLS